MSVNEPLPTPHRDFARDNIGDAILASACDPTSARPPAQGPRRKKDKQAKDRTQTSVSLIAVPFYKCT